MEAKLDSHRQEDQSGHRSWLSVSRIPIRDKHAHGVAERSVGNIVTKAKIAMIGNVNNPCPHTYWNNAIQYACHCHDFGYKSRIGTSPYFYLTLRHVHLKYLHLFWALV